MKKIYLSLASLVLCGSIMSQNAFNMQDHNLAKAVLAPNAVMQTTTPSTERAAGPFRLWTEPIGDIMTQKGLDLTTANANQGLFLSPIFMDSTVRVGNGTSTTNFVTSILLGSVLDPKSTNLQASFDPIVSIADPYSIDSLIIYGSYIKKTAAVDTLYTWLVWGAPSNANVFTKRLTNTTWAAPISTWRDSVIGPKITGAFTGPGNKVKPAAPAGNFMLIKHILVQADSSSSGHFKPIKFKLPTVAAIPAGNIVSCFYTFVPAGTYAAGDCIYSFTGATLQQNKNGFAGIVWGQTNPALTQLSDYVDQQVDPTSWCMGASYDNSQRHNVYPSTWSTFMAGDLTTAPLIAYSIFGTATSPLAVPVAAAASNITCTSFNAHWAGSAGATVYFLDVSTNAGFTTFVAGYNNLNVGNVITYNVTGLTTGIVYYYRLRASNGTTTTLNSNTITVASCTTAINEINVNSSIKVYPNPAKDKLIVSINKNGSSAIIITDILGKRVKEVITNELQTEINVSDLQDGIYFIKLTKDNASFVEKIIISK